MSSERDYTAVLEELEELDEHEYDPTRDYHDIEDLPEVDESYSDHISKAADIMGKGNVLDATPKQEQLFKLVAQGGILHVLYGGAVGGAKTVGWLMVVYTLCKVFPGSRWIYIRKDARVLKRNTIPSFWKTCPKPFFHPARFNKTEGVAKASNGSEIIFMGENFDKDKELTAFDGLEANGAILEDAQELTEALFHKLIDRIGRWKLDPMPPLLIGLSCNPHQGWLKNTFYIPWQQGRLEAPKYFIQALPSDNPHLDENYLISLESLKKTAPALYRKRVQGSWEAEDDVQQLISWDDINACEELIDMTELLEKDEWVPDVSMGVDVGRNGPDPSKWYVLEGDPDVGYNIIHVEGYAKTTGPEVEAKTKELIERFEISHHRVWMDTVGLGAFALDHLVEDGYEIQSFMGGAKPVEQYVIQRNGSKKEMIFKNLNTQASWNLKILMNDRHLGGVTDHKLKEDLASYKYDIRGEKMIWVSPKDEVKKVLNRSPDDGDGLKYAVWGHVYDKVSPEPGMEVI